jgi:transcriptional regulator with XRE-family HTH domain
MKISRQAYSSYETGARQMNFETLCMLADFYGVSTEYLLGRKDEAPLDDEEKNLLRLYRKVSRHARDSIMNHLKFEHSRGG